MLTGKLVRIRYARNRIIPHYLPVDDPELQETAERMIDLFRGQEGKSRGRLEEDFREIFGDDPSQLVHQGLAKLLEDRCEFEVESSQPPEQVRAAVFRLAAEERRKDEEGLAPFDRAAVLTAAASELNLTVEEVEQALFADLKSEQRLTTFKDITPERLLQRYNVALAQAVLLRSSKVRVTVRGETPQRLRQLLRRVKFHRLVCEVRRVGDSVQLHVDGPLSLFSSTQKYGLQLSFFLPSVLLAKDFELEADLLWGPQRKPKQFALTASDGLVSHIPDAGTYLPQEMALFVELFRKKITDWEIHEESEIFPLGQGFWVPDFRLVHPASGESVHLEVLGFWRRSSAEKHLADLRAHRSEPFLLAVSDQLHIDESELEGLPAGIHRFRNMPLPDELIRLARELVQGNH